MRQLEEIYREIAEGFACSPEDIERVVNKMGWKKLNSMTADEIKAAIEKLKVKVSEGTNSKCQANTVVSPKALVQQSMGRNKQITPIYDPNMPQSELNRKGRRAQKKLARASR